MDRLCLVNVPLRITGCLTLALMAGVSGAMQVSRSDQVARGEYLVRAGDCAFCHTAPRGRPFAGGRGIPTPFGEIYSTNITPDRDTGIGKWSAQDFYQAMHAGIGADGRRLYPAFPYPWFTKITRADVGAIKTYLDTLKPVVQINRANGLPWYLRWRPILAGWNMLYFDAGAYKPDATRSARWNRGAYLVKGLGHCGACHTPKNVLGASQKHDRFDGGSAGLHWYAPALTGAIRDGIGGWSTAQIVEYLKTGANAKSATAGPMTEVVMNSTQYLDAADLDAIATYLQDRRNEPAKSPPKAAEYGDGALARGQALYLDNCTACHLPDGYGVPKVFPPLAGSAAIQAENPGSIIHVVLTGARMAAVTSKPTGLAMPGFGRKLDDAELADLINYIRHAWGNRAPSVDAHTIAAVRKEIKSGLGDPASMRR